uniref:RGS domain-containing protein n=1 Tax=Heterorhabditis bacteriophora TaxID=37862 RepID=A0A1I7W7N3_HETBA
MGENRNGSDLEAILQDAAALEVFRQWIRSDPSHPSDCLSLYFAIKGFKEYLSHGDPRSANMACQLHRKFIRLFDYT